MEIHIVHMVSESFVREYAYVLSQKASVSEYGPSVFSRGANPDITNLLECLLSLTSHKKISEDNTSGGTGKQQGTVPTPTNGIAMQPTKQA